jgi:MFS family permease
VRSSLEWIWVSSGVCSPCLVSRRKIHRQCEVLSSTDLCLRQYGLVDKPDKELANLSSNIVSVIQAGAFAGCIIAMWLANQIGRRLSLITASVFVFVGVALQAAASGHIAAMYTGR